MDKLTTLSKSLPGAIQCSGVDCAYSVNY